MIEVKIPGYKNLNIENIVFDYNGTIAVDGVVSEDIKKELKDMSKYLNIHIVTADTYGNVKKQCQGLPVEVQTFPGDNAAVHKKEIVKKLGEQCTAAVGNGINDVEMFKISALAVAVIEEEGCAAQAIMNSHIAVKSIKDLFHMFMKKNRIKATLRA